MERADAAIIKVCNVNFEVGSRTEGKLLWGQSGQYGRSAILNARSRGTAIACHGRDNTRAQDHLTDPVGALIVGIQSIGNIQQAAPDKQGLYFPERRFQRRSIVARKPAHTCPGDGGDDPGGIDAPNAAVIGVTDVNGSIVIDGHGVGAIELGIYSRPTVSRKPGFPIAHHRADSTGGDIDTANAVVLGIGDIDVALGIE